MTKDYKPDSIYNDYHYRGNNVRLGSHARAKEMYEKVKPLGGGRKKYGIDLRPLTDRHRYWEALIKDSGSYGVGFVTSYAQYSGKVPRVITGFNHSEKQLLMVHPDESLTFTRTYMSSYSTWGLLGALLPRELALVKFGAKQYIRALQEGGGYKYYHVPRSGNPVDNSIRFLPRATADGGRVFDVLGCNAETKYIVDRKLTNIVRDKFAKFMDYYDYMHKLLDQEVAETLSHSWVNRMKAERFFRSSDWLGLDWDNADEFPPLWGEAVKHMILTHTSVRWERESDSYKTDVRPPEAIRSLYHGEALYAITRPYKAVEVELGVPFRRNGREITF